MEARIWSADLVQWKGLGWRLWTAILPDCGFQFLNASVRAALDLALGGKSDETIAWLSACGSVGHKGPPYSRPTSWGRS